MCCLPDLHEYNGRGAQRDMDWLLLLLLQSNSLAGGFSRKDAKISIAQLVKTNTQFIHRQEALRRAQMKATKTYKEQNT